MFRALLWLHKTTLVIVATHDALGGEEAQRVRCECTFPLRGINLVRCLVNPQVYATIWKVFTLFHVDVIVLFGLYPVCFAACTLAEHVFLSIQCLELPFYFRWYSSVIAKNCPWKLGLRWLLVSHKPGWFFQIHFLHSYDVHVMGQKVVTSRLPQMNSNWYPCQCFFFPCSSVDHSL
jgi:hypothetical protein